MTQFLIQVRNLVYDPVDVPFQHAERILRAIDKYNGRFHSEHEFYICGNEIEPEKMLSTILSGCITEFSAYFNNAANQKADDTFIGEERFSLLFTIDKFREGCITAAMHYFMGKDYAFPFLRTECGEIIRPEEI